MRRPLHHPRASAIIMALVVSIIISALVVVMCSVATEQTRRAASLAKIDQAFYAAEAGAQRIQWYCKNNQLAAISSPLDDTLNGYIYSVSWSAISGSTIQITSVASAGDISYTLFEQVTPPSIQQPAIESLGNFDNKNIFVTGDIIAGGNYANSGSGSLTGDLTYYGTASNTGSVSGSVTHASGPPPTINFASTVTTLKAAAGRSYSGNQNNRTFNFTAIPGNQKVIYVNGNVSNPTFIGSGTLVVSGNVTGAGNFGSTGNPVNLVATGNITTNNNNTSYGSLYSGGNWNRGKFNLTGIVYIAGIIQSNNGTSYLKQDTTPWFDPRANGGGAGGGATTLISNFAGPMP